jgi:hypothetical protein
MLLFPSFSSFGVDGCELYVMFWEGKRKENVKKLSTKKNFIKPRRKTEAKLKQNVAMIEIQVKETFVFFSEKCWKTQKTAGKRKLKTRK